MSTFNGFVSEFPHIRVDQFRPLQGKPPPLACFLSHVHSDHLVGLDSFKSPFIYCSAATKELVLRLEKYPHRMNFSKGILESRKQTYKHLVKVLRPLPLDTPTTILLSPSNEVRVTLIDANHCLGAVMFLIEGQGKAILYTGDIRAESWWMNALTRHPSLIRFTMPRKRLTTIYLDTTFATKSDPYKTFPSKAEGLTELLDSIACYAEDFTFYFHSWTFGYEDVWRTLSQVLGSQIHLDRYRHGIYASVGGRDGKGSGVSEAPTLSGFMNGNERHPGILTRNPTARIHSCERGSSCWVFDDTNKNIVDIMPIISRHKGVEMRELGAGGGQGDLNQNHELDLSTVMDLGTILSLCAKEIADPVLLEQIAGVLKASLTSEDKRIQLDDFEDFKLPEDEDIPLDLLPRIMTSLSRHFDDRSAKPAVEAAQKPSTNTSPFELPKSITFPYSRHSSYNELRELITAFRPNNIFPCTAPPPYEWTEELSMANLFGDLCDVSDAGFSYDNEMRRLREERRQLKRKHNQDFVVESQQIHASRRRTFSPLRDSSPLHETRSSSDDDVTDSEVGFHDALAPPQDAGPAEQQQTHAQAVKQPIRASEKRQNLPAMASENTPPKAEEIPSPLSKTDDHEGDDLSSGRGRKQAYEAALNGMWHEETTLRSVDPYEESQEL